LVKRGLGFGIAQTPAELLLATLRCTVKTIKTKGKKEIEK
jgi:hypothetical protein